MKDYWDSSAIVKALRDAAVMDRFKQGGVTRSHALAEVFSTLTGGKLGFRFSPRHATAMINRLCLHLEFVELSAEEIVVAFESAQNKAVTGGRVHDYLHAVAADKAGCKRLLTLDRNDYAGLGRAMVEMI